LGSSQIRSRIDEELSLNYARPDAHLGVPRRGGQCSDALDLASCARDATGLIEQRFEIGARQYLTADVASGFEAACSFQVEAFASFRAQR